MAKCWPISTSRKPNIYSSHWRPRILYITYCRIFTYSTDCISRVMSRINRSRKPAFWNTYFTYYRDGGLILLMTGDRRKTSNRTRSFYLHFQKKTRGEYAVVHAPAGNEFGSVPAGQSSDYRPAPMAPNVVLVYSGYNGTHYGYSTHISRRLHPRLSWAKIERNPIRGRRWKQSIQQATLGRLRRVGASMNIIGVIHFLPFAFIFNPGSISFYPAWGIRLTVMSWFRWALAW